MDDVHEDMRAQLDDDGLTDTGDIIFCGLVFVCAGVTALAIALAVYLMWEAG